MTIFMECNRQLAELEHIPLHLFLTLLFVPPNGSIDCTESISSRKYPEYEGYQNRVSRFIPYFQIQNQTDCNHHALLIKVKSL